MGAGETVAFITIAMPGYQQGNPGVGDNCPSLDSRISFLGSALKTANLLMGVGRLLLRNRGLDAIMGLHCLNLPERGRWVLPWTAASFKWSIQTPVCAPKWNTLKSGVQGVRYSGYP